MFRYMVDGGNQPGIALLKAVRIFDPASATLLSSAKEEYDSHIPGFKDVSRQEFELYLELARKGLIVVCLGIQRFFFRPFGSPTLPDYQNFTLCTLCLKISRCLQLILRDHSLISNTF